MPKSAAPLLKPAEHKKQDFTSVFTCRDCILLKTVHETGKMNATF